MSVPEPVVNPQTGEALPDDPEALSDALDAVERYLRRQRPHYAYRDALRQRLADLRGPVRLPRPRYRTERQMRVAACPACGRKPELVDDNPFHEDAA